MVLALVAGSVPWLGSVSYSVQLPSTMNRLLDFEPASPKMAFSPRLGGSPSFPQAIFQPGGPALIPGRARATVLEKRLPFRATELGVLWKGNGPPPLLRTSQDGRRWTQWSQLEDYVDLHDARTGTHFSALVAGRNARFVQARAAEGSSARPFRVAVINTADGPREIRRVSRSAHAAMPGPEVISRAAWGADESMRGGEGTRISAKKIFIHHTNTANNDADPAGTIRAMYSYHVKTRGFHDIGYNFLIDQRGRIYEGRYSAAPASGEAAFGEDANGRTVLGAHAKDHNADSIGIAMIGNSDAAAPSARAENSLVAVASWVADRHGIDPLGKFSHRDPATGKKETLPNIAGHKDSSATVTRCPGQRLYARLSQIRKRVAETIFATSAQSAPSMPVGTRIEAGSPSKSMMPNAAGDVTRSAIRVDLIFQAKGEGADRTISVVPSEGAFAVTDAVYGKKPLAPGIYAVRAVAFDAHGRSSPAAQVADGYELRRPALPALDELVRPLVRSGEAKPRSNDLTRAIHTVIKVLGL